MYKNLFKFKKYDSIKYFYKKIIQSIFKINLVKEFWQFKYLPVKNDEVPWSPLVKPLKNSRLVLITTGGVHLKNDTPFDMTDLNGDPSFRIIPSNTNPEDLMITHDYYDHRDADKDLNIVFPWQVIQTLVDDGFIGSITDKFISFMGHIDGHHINTLVKQTAINAAEKIEFMQADIALLVPS